MHHGQRAKENQEAVISTKKNINTEVKIIFKEPNRSSEGFNVQ